MQRKFKPLEKAEVATMIALA